MALQIAAALRAELSPGERARIQRQPTADLQAYRLYLEGRHCLLRFTDEGLRQSLEFLQQAIDRDPGFALAHVARAQAFAEIGIEGSSFLEPRLAFEQAKAAVGQAVALDNGLGDAHGIVGLLCFAYDFDWAGAEREFQLAFELSPGNADVHDHYGWMCAALERYDDALNAVRRAQELDPMAHRSDVAAVLLRAGRYQEARDEAGRLVEIEPGYSRGHSSLGWADLLMGRPAPGLAALERAVALAPGSTMFLGQLGQAYAFTGQTDKARQVLRDLHELARRQSVPPYHFAYVHAGLGEADIALDWLERAYEQRAGAVYGIKGSFLFTTLRTQPRFVALLAKMNLA